MDSILNRQPPTYWERFLSSPLLFLNRLLYTPLPLLAQSNHSHKIRIVCISDTHNTHHSQPTLPDADILIHAGDLTVSGTQHELDDVLSWLESQPHPYKFFISGNHDTILANPEMHQYVSSKYPSLTYLQQTSVQVTIRGRTLHIYGSPYTPQHGSWVFQYPPVRPPSYSASIKPTSDYQSTEIWSHIPPLTDILITHGPPLGHLDNNTLNLEKSARGCYSLLTALWRVRPKVHVFGHIHVGRGVELVKWDASQKVYEEILANTTGWRGLLSLVRYTVSAWFWRESLGEDGATIMVNAASVGGLRDEQKKGAIAVEI